MSQGDKTSEDRFRVHMDNANERDLFTYTFFDNGEAIERGNALHPRIVGQRFDTFKARRQWEAS